MWLVEELKRQQASEPSYFRQHLLMEDTKRLERLAELAASCDDVTEFVAAGMNVGWTAEDRRTHELLTTIEPLLVAIYARMRLDTASPDRSGLDQQIGKLWQTFETNRMDQLIGCLSRIPRPPDTSDR
jgi:hypothetical protein